jgi:predicted transcriptional regulator
VSYLSTSELAHSTLFRSVSSVNSTEPSSIGELASQAERAIRTHSLSSLSSVDRGCWGFEADGSGRGAISRFFLVLSFLFFFALFCSPPSHVF